MEVDIIILLWLHFLGDFILQDDKTALNKSSSNIVLLKHVAIYSSVFIFFGVYFVLINAVLHFIVDYFSSRAAKKLWENNERHWFFVIIGLDQMLHLSCLFITYWWLTS